nr:hypothetical protein [Leptospira weilii]
MSTMTNAAIFQLIYTTYFFVTHFIPMKPFNDLSKEAFSNEKKVNLSIIAVQLAIVPFFLYDIFWGICFGAFYYLVNVFGNAMSWWFPYFFGWPKSFAENAEEENKKTFRILPPIKNHLIPDVVHIGITILIWANWILSLQEVLQRI